MDTPAITPEILAQHSNSASTGSETVAAAPQSQPQSRQAHPHPHPHFLPHQPKIRGTPAMDSNFFFAKSLRPLSPPESPFAFDAAFSAKPHHTPSSSSSSTAALQTSRPHVRLPALDGPTALAKPLTSTPKPNPPTTITTTTTRTKRERGWAKAVVPQRTPDNPYFPSTAEQQRAEQWARDQQRRSSSPAPAPPAAVELGGADPSSHASSSCSSSSASTASSRGPRFNLHLGEGRRRRALGGCADVPAASSERLGGGVGGGRATGVEGEVEEVYRREMARYLVERIRRRSVRPEPLGRRDGEEGGFEW
ncbi:hypothetical protein PMIN04_006656 [Paraphaeosphaeria minitans]|uniref:Uncharacterized protein n=1 Tax=Paraphaeosphaeria minitans TaxID=565426 RepID=A0A9P6GA01_9PLEO|nr:hypothetical protein PMIN01_10669 [Paraphaeosphaeria minitans]